MRAVRGHSFTTETIVEQGAVEGENATRHYIRHPADIPIELIPEVNPLALSESIDDVMKVEKMENVSSGGLMFQSAIPYMQSKRMIVKITGIKPEFEACATVSWCRKSGRFYLVGLEFIDKDTEFKVRMVEQVCHIMHYKNEVLANEGRKLGNDEAAKEWGLNTMRAIFQNKK